MPNNLWYSIILSVRLVLMNALVEHLTETSNTENITNQFIGPCRNFLCLPANKVKIIRKILMLKSQIVAFNSSFEDLPNFSIGENWPAHRFLCTRISIEENLDVQFESVLVDFFEMLFYTNSSTQNPMSWSVFANREVWKILNTKVESYQYEVGKLPWKLDSCFHLSISWRTIQVQIQVQHQTFRHASFSNFNQI